MFLREPCWWCRFALHLWCLCSVTIKVLKESWISSLSVVFLMMFKQNILIQVKVHLQCLSKNSSSCDLWKVSAQIKHLYEVSLPQNSTELAVNLSNYVCITTPAVLVNIFPELSRRYGSMELLSSCLFSLHHIPPTNKQQNKRQQKISLLGQRNLQNHKHWI